MSRLADIPVRVEMPNLDTNDISIAHVTLQQIEFSLSRFMEEGKGNVIDLRALPNMSSSCYQYLQDELSLGEVSAVVESQLKIEIRETQYPGVWWITHFNEQKAIVTELIEIAEIPSILKAHPEDIRGSYSRLKERMAELAAKN